MQSEVLKWFGTGRVGQSSKAMALAVTATPGNRDYPRDPSDLNRCLLFLEAVPQARQHMDRVAGLSPTWARLVEHWDEIEQSFLDEVGRDGCKARSAPITYKLMQSVIGR